MDSAELLARAKHFALDSLAFYRKLPKTPDEAVGWLEFMDEGGIAANKALLGEATELCAILTASLTTARANWEAEQAARRKKKRTRSILVQFPEPRF